MVKNIFNRALTDQIQSSRLSFLVDSSASSYELLFRCFSFQFSFFTNIITLWSSQSLLVLFSGSLDRTSLIASPDPIKWSGCSDSEMLGMLPIIACDKHSSSLYRCPS
jgi:hypothetical protein